MSSQFDFEAICSVVDLNERFTGVLVEDESYVNIENGDGDGNKMERKAFRR